MTDYKEKYEKWLKSEKLTAEEKAELKALSKDEKEVEYAFGKSLEFGTAGMRGIIGMGTNKMNVYTVMLATQGLAGYIKSLGEKAKKRGVVISYDTRRQSKEFATVSATVLATNGIKVYLFSEVHPVPMLSFSVRCLKTTAGIMITASHNPKEYNGFKVYGPDGAQMSPEATKKVVDIMTEIGDPLSDEILCDKGSQKKILNVPEKVDKTYYKTIGKLTLSPKEVKAIGKDIKLVYTPVHGSGYIPVTTILLKKGIKATLVEEQVNPDTEFSTVELPNPEFKETLSLGIKKAKSVNAEVVFGTDPDCDRLGVALKDDSGEFKALSGNQVGILLLDYILMRLKERGELKDNGFVVKSFVTTSMAKLIADDYGVKMYEVPVGFKYIGEKIKQYSDTGEKEFIFGFEESCGYLRGTHARDKDAVVASMLFAEMVCYYGYQKISIFERLNELYKKYGYVYDGTVSTTYKGLNAMQEMNGVVGKIREMQIKEVGGVKIKAKRDYLSLERIDDKGEKSEIDCSKVNAVYYEIEGGGFICVRPSGTEPKLKVYYSVSAENENKAIELFEKIKKDFEEIMSK